MCVIQNILRHHLLYKDHQTIQRQFQVPSDNKIPGESQLSVDDYLWEHEEKVETGRGVTESHRAEL